MKVLLISSHIFGYMEYIAQEIKNQNHALTHFYYNDPPIIFEYSSQFEKIIYGSAKVLGYNHKKKFRERKLKKLLKEKKFDRILVMNPHYLNHATHKFLASKTDKYITYLYDSVTKIPALKKFTYHFDEVYSYEPKDCHEFNYKFITNYIPSRDYTSNTFAYDVFNIIGVDERFGDLQRLAQYFHNHDISAKLLLLNKKDYPHFERVESIMWIQEVFEYIKKCKIMLDIQRPIQEGLTFRVFEAIGNNKKLITTNKSIRNYDFYNEENILILDLDKIHIPNSFLNTPFKPISSSIIEKYTVQQWVKSVLQ